MSGFDHIYRILADAGAVSQPAPQPLYDEQLAARAQSAELLGQPIPRPQTAAQAQATDMRAADRQPADPVADCVAERGGDPSLRDGGLPDTGETAELTAECEASEQGIADLPPRPEPVATEEVLDARSEGQWQTDSLAARLSDTQMAGLDLADRMALVRHIAHGARVDGEDEQTIIRLLASAPDPAAVLVELRSEQSALFRQLDQVIDGESHAEYRVVLRAAWFAALGPAEAAAAMQDPVAALPWADPGLIGALTGDGRVVYDRVEIGDDGLVHIEARVMRGPLAIPLAWPALDPLAMVAVRYFADEVDFEAGAGELQYMPAVEFLGLYHKQVGQTRRQLLDLSLIGLGGMGLVGAGSRLAKVMAAVETAVGAADLVIREHRAAIAGAEGGQTFLDIWDQVMTLAAVYGVAQVARQLPDLVRGARNAWRRASGQADGLDAPGRAAVEARLGELEAQIQHAQRASKLRQPNASAEAIQGTEEALAAARPHVRETNFTDRAVSNVPDTGRLPGGVQVPGLNKTITLEPIGDGPPISTVEVFDAAGASLGKVGAVKVNGQDVYKIPFEPSMRVRIRRADDVEVEWVSGNAPPPGLRARLNINKKFRTQGLAGGHTRGAWEQTKATYPGLLRESGGQRIGFEIPGHGPIQVTRVKYEVQARGEWHPVQQPKTLFEGQGNRQIAAFEEHMTPYAAEAMGKAAADAREIDVAVPVLTAGGEPAEVIVKIMRQPPGTDGAPGQIHSWWISPRSIDDPRLTARLDEAVDP